MQDRVVVVLIGCLMGVVGFFLGSPRVILHPVLIFMVGFVASSFGIPLVSDLVRWSFKRFGKR